MDPGSRFRLGQDREVGQLLKRRRGGGLSAPVAALLACALGGWWTACVAVGPAPGARADGEPVLAPGERVLVVAPHPDDEVLATGGLLAIAARRGIATRVVLVTAGDGYADAARTFLHVPDPGPADFLRLGAIRWQESREGLEAVGAASGRVDLLGFPDGGIGALWADREAGRDPLRPSPFTAAAAVPYPDSPALGVAYRQSELARLLEREIEEFRPSLVVFPLPQDVQADHAATGRFVLAAARAAKLDAGAPGPRLLGYLVHHPLWPIGDAGSDPMPPPLPAWVPGVAWQSLAVDEPARGVKIEALARHRSQMTVMGRFLMRFARGSELFAALPPGAAATPGQPGGP